MSFNRSHSSRDYKSNREREHQNKEYKRRRSTDSPPPTNKKMAKTLEGKRAGLQDARQLRDENDSFRRREEEAFEKLSDDVSGRNAHAVSRRSGKRDTSEERRQQRQKADKQKELNNKYQLWSKGVKQARDQEERVQEYLHESKKPLARHKDDKDLEELLKNQTREGDPMLKYIKEKKKERGEPPARPTYKGSFAPNRFNIRPGYRWDGVDRSNGYEKKYFENQSKRKAQDEEVYKWNVADL